MFPTILGRDTTTDRDVTLENISRHSGVYVLGKSGMGKSVLLASMACQDDHNKHGFFFLDPHGDVTKKILPYLFSQAACVLDVEDETHSFGINLLACRNKDSLRERTATYTRAYNAFKKIFQNEKGEWGPWLQEVIQYSLYVFIENQGYTLAELPLFLIDKDFRETLLRNVRHNLDAVTFWRREFQPDQAKSALTRIRTLLGHEIVRDIIGQETTLDFAKVMDEDLVVILQLSSNLPEDAKRFLGIIVLNELLHAVRNRPEGKRHPFGIFIDEMHNFVSSDDLSTLITEGRKFGVMFCGAHVERYGQLADYRKIAGATLATLNKVFFQLSVADAQEVAAEFADKPPVEHREERALVIAKDPVWELIHTGHPNPRIQELSREFFNGLWDEVKQLGESIEDIRLELTQSQADAAYYQSYASRFSIDERRTNVAASNLRGRGIAVSHDALDEMEAAYDLMLSARGLSQSQLAKLEWAHKWFRNFRHRLERANTFIRDIMEGRIKPIPGEQRLAEFIIDTLGTFYVGPSEKGYIYFFYVRLRFGDPTISIKIPAAFALKYYKTELDACFLKMRQERDHQAWKKGIYSQYRICGQSEEKAEKEWQQKLQELIAEDKELLRQGEVFYEDDFPCLKEKDKRGLLREVIEGRILRLPDLPERLFVGSERHRMQQLAAQELPHKITFEKIEELLELIALLQKPENHIKVQSGQYIEKPQHTRTTHDMAGEMVQTLTSLPRYTAMVKLMEDTQSVKYTMKTRGIEAPRHGFAIQGYPDVTRPRVEILTDTYQRQTQWQVQSLPPKPQPEPSASPQNPSRRGTREPPPSVL